MTTWSNIADNLDKSMQAVYFGGDTHLGQNQSPLGTCVTIGVKHFICQPSLHLSHKNILCLLVNLVLSMAHRLDSPGSNLPLPKIYIKIMTRGTVFYMIADAFAIPALQHKQPVWLCSTTRNILLPISGSIELASWRFRYAKSPTTNRLSFGLKSPERLYAYRRVSLCCAIAKLLKAIGISRSNISARSVMTLAHTLGSSKSTVWVKTRLIAASTIGHLQKRRKYGE